MNQTLSERLLKYLQAPGYTAQDISSIARGLEISTTERAKLRHLLHEWTKNGSLLRLRQSRYLLKTTIDSPLTGRVHQLPSGRMLFIPDLAGQQSLRSFSAESSTIKIPVQRHYTATAMDGDLVQALIRRNTPTSLRRHRRGKRTDEKELRFEARIVEITKRRFPIWIGIYRSNEKFGIMRGDGRTCPEVVQLTTAPPPDLHEGMCIAVSPTRYAIGHMTATGQITEVLGWPGTQEVDTEATIRKFGLKSIFPPTVIKETAALPEKPPAEELAQRSDWRDRCVITIDPTNARDFDDAISLRQVPGGWELAVHIADVSYYVRPGSATDLEAKARGNSTYLPDRVLPMLPAKLCENLCSLREGVERLTRLCLLNIDSEGKLIQAKFYNAVICSCCRLDYSTALAIIEGRTSSGQKKVDTMLHQGAQLASRLKKRRLDLGALDLDIPNIRIATDEQGHTTGVETETSDIAHQMIEEFMLIANEAVAQALRQNLIPTIYRIHEAPSPEKLHDFTLTANSCGIHTGSLNSREELRNVMTQIKSHPEKRLLTAALLKAMMRAQYSPYPLGHFGLAKGDYCHFTSPIRRYADLVVHRSFSKLIRNQTAHPSIEDLASTAEHVSETERNSAAAEHEAQQARIIYFLKEQSEAEEPLVWQALVTDTKPQGLCIDITDLQMRAFIAKNDLSNPTHWFFRHHSQRWESIDGQTILPGTKLQIIPLHVDPLTYFITCKHVDSFS